MLVEFCNVGVVFSLIMIDGYGDVKIEVRLFG